MAMLVKMDRVKHLTDSIAPERSTEDLTMSVQRYEYPAGPLRKWLQKQLPVILVLLMALPANAESIEIATGEYSPFVTQQLPDDGITAAIVSAAFKAAGVDVTFTFLPWKRGYHDTELGKYVGTFPYVRNAEREALFLYSEPMYVDQVRLFVRETGNAERSWSGKRLCVPHGYDTSLAEEFIAKHAMSLERPAEMANCFSMLDAGRVEAVWASELVGKDTARSLFGSQARVFPLNSESGASIKYHLMVSKKLPDGPKRIAQFNKGLKAIEKNGTYTKIRARFMSMVRSE